MATRRHERSQARAQALQLLYGCEVRGVAPSSLGDDEFFIDNVPVSAYGRELVKGVETHQEELDEALASTSDNWSVHRMPIVDRCLLRLAAYEMIHCDDVPISVTINEAVELARSFGGEDESPRFVNGVLGRIAIDLEAKDGMTDASAASDADASAVADAVASAVATENDSVADAVATEDDSVADASVAEDNEGEHDH